jgi:alkylation response protein AidB-like acyl-CoA dehydrogenase
MFGTEGQKRRYVVPLARGERLGAWGLTEPTAGSDAGGTKTRAVKQADCWVLNGSKTFTTNGRVGHVMVAMAVTDPAAGHHGISAFVVEHGTPGMSAGRKENKMGMRASDTSEVVLQDCRIPAGHLVGQPGEGFVNALQVLEAGRIGIAALAVGLAQGAHEAAVRYARERRQFGQAIASFQAIQWKIADDATAIEAARLLTYRAAHMKDRGRPTRRESAMAKLFASETAVRVADNGVQIHGGYGFVKDYPAEKYFRDVKLTTIGEGTSEIQRLIIAREILGR